MSSTALATFEGGPHQVEVTICEMSYGYAARVRLLGSVEQLGSKPFRYRAEAVAYGELLTERPVEWGRAAASYGEMAILLATYRVDLSVGVVRDKRPVSLSPYYAHAYARLAARYAFLALPELREYPRNLDEPGADRNDLCVCGHKLSHHVADRLPCLEDGEERTCRAFQKEAQA